MGVGVMYGDGGGEVVAVSGRGRSDGGICGSEWSWAVVGGGGDDDDDFL